jgi:inhibitor of cysteine peptidase
MLDNIHAIHPSRLVAIFILGLFLFISLEGVARDRVATDADNGKTITIFLDDILTLNLDGNPTTGFMWKIDSVDRDCLQIVEQSYQPSSNLVGSGGVFSFSFHAGKAGSSPLSVVYTRPWERNIPPAKSFQITVLIEDQNKSEEESAKLP